MMGREIANATEPYFSMRNEEGRLFSNLSCLSCGTGQCVRARQPVSPASVLVPLNRIAGGAATQGREA